MTHYDALCVKDSIKKQQYNAAQYKQFVGDGTQRKNEQKNIKSQTKSQKQFTVSYCEASVSQRSSNSINSANRLFCACSETAASVYRSIVEILISRLAFSCPAFSCPATSCPAISV